MYLVALLPVMLLTARGDVVESTDNDLEKIVKSMHLMSHVTENRTSSTVIDAIVMCDATAEQPFAPRNTRWHNLTHVLLSACATTAPPALAANGARPEIITTLAMMDVPNNVTFNASNFEGFDALESLRMQAAGGDHPQLLNDSSLLPLRRLKVLWLTNLALPPLPRESQVENVTLEAGLSLGAWGGCNQLRLLTMRDWRVPLSANASGCVAHCSSLTNLWAERMELDELQALLTGISRSMRKLSLPNNNLTWLQLNSLFDKLANNQLLHLNLSNNYITYINFTLDKQENLTTLDLSRNILTSFSDIMLNLHGQLFLQELYLDHNLLGDSCMGEGIYIGMPHQLQVLSLVGTNSSRFCFAEWMKLHTLNLAHNNITQLQIGQFLIGLTDDEPMEIIIDLRHNPLRDLHFNKSDYDKLRWHKLTVHTDPLEIDCDCHLGWWKLALATGRLLPGRISCISYKDRSKYSTECAVQSCAPCSCRLDSGGVLVNCDGIPMNVLTDSAISNLPLLTEVYLRGTGIHTAQVEKLPNTLMIVDLRDNELKGANERVIAELFSVPERLVMLSGNPFACDCDNWQLISKLQAHEVQVVDYKNVTCAESGDALYNQTYESLCERKGVQEGTGEFTGKDTGEGAVVWVLIVGLAVVSWALYAQLARRLKVWLSARGWCLCCVREEELDADRKYDVFLSFAHGDYEFVASQLLPGLEGGPRGYKLCLHYRDWIAGELIAMQITRSVAASQRTVILLSAHFVRSAWGLMEFRAAHMSALAEGRVRLVVVALQDAPPAEELPEELRLYVRTTTYLRWDDPAFWDKLRYVLPHRTAAPL